MTSRPVTGWREWVALPALGIPAIKAKIDTGARTSALHTFDLETFADNGLEYARFRLHPLQKRTDIELTCIAPVLEQRIVRDSGGHAEERLVIRSDIVLGSMNWPIEITLTNRDDMMFRMLLGRSALRGAELIVDPAASYRFGRKLARVYKQHKTE
jgi:hypothetical protein